MSKQVCKAEQLTQIDWPKPPISLLEADSYKLELDASRSLRVAKNFSTVPLARPAKHLKLETPEQTHVDARESSSNKDQ